MNVQSQMKMEKIANLYKEVKHREQRINYHADIYIGGCNYEVLINDMPVDNYFGPANGAMSGSSPINTSILKAGLQTWKIRVYPEHTREVIEGKVAMIPETSISKGVIVEMTIEGVRFLENGNIEKLGKVLEFEAETEIDSITTKRVFKDADKPYIEYKGTFRAEVPYELTGWSKSQDLKKQDSNKIKEEVLKAYEEASNLIEDKMIEKFENKVLNKEKEVAQALFFNKKNSDEISNFYLKSFTNESLKMLPIENYKVIYYGNGKVVCLKRIDYKGDFALASVYTNEKGEDRMINYNYLLHKPEGSDKLEVIR